MDDREQVALLAGRHGIPARRHVGAAAACAAAACSSRSRAARASGKSTQIALLAEHLRDRGRTVTVTHEPGAHRRRRADPRTGAAPPRTAARRAPRRCCSPPTARTTSTPSSGRRSTRGEVVLTDRYIDSSLAYQGVGRELTVDEVRRISRWATARPASGPHRSCSTCPRRDGLARARRPRCGRQARGRVAAVPRAGARSVPVLAEAEPRLLPRARRPPAAPQRSRPRCSAAVDALLTPSAGSTDPPRAHGDRRRRCRRTGGACDERVGRADRAGRRGRDPAGGGRARPPTIARRGRRRPAR